MNVLPVSYNSQISMKSDNKTAAKKRTVSDIVNTPVGIASVAGVGAFGIGLGIDRLCSCMFGTSRDIKSSLIVNGLVAAAISAYTYTQAKSVEK